VVQDDAKPRLGRQIPNWGTGRGYGPPNDKKKKIKIIFFANWPSPFYFFIFFFAHEGKKLSPKKKVT
jgi:hypothetical protein